MTRNNTIKSFFLATGAALVLSAFGGSAMAEQVNPFAMTQQSQNYSVATAADGKCGGTEKKAEAKCGEGKCGGMEKKADAKAADGKCGGMEKKDDAKAVEGKCGGMEKKAEAKCGAAK